ncbi:MAG: ArdC-like ssDNA-binding domain-containing protein [Candidatus Dormibacteria bacterium]
MASGGAEHLLQAPNQARHEAALRQLREGITGLASSEGWARWLGVCRRFRTYSFSNQVLILAQRPEATWVAGYRTWQGLGRQVCRGERGIAILAPCWPRQQAHEPNDEGPADPLGVPAFRLVRVFDVTQTEGDDLPQPVRELEGEAPLGQVDQLLARAAAAGFSVDFLELRGQRHGDCSHTLRRIRIDSRLGLAQTVKTLTHELAHMLLHGDDFQGSRALAELEAESVAYVACQDLGIDSSCYSFGYVTSWAGGGVEAVQSIALSGARITAAAGQILEPSMATLRTQMGPSHLVTAAGDRHPTRAGA